MPGLLPGPATDRLGPPPSTVGFSFDNSGGLPRASASERRIPGIANRSTLLARSFSARLTTYRSLFTHRFFGGAPYRDADRQDTSRQHRSLREEGEDRGSVPSMFGGGPLLSPDKRSGRWAGKSDQSPGRRAADDGGSRGFPLGDCLAERPGAKRLPRHDGQPDQGSGGRWLPLARTDSHE